MRIWSRKQCATSRPSLCWAVAWHLRQRSHIAAADIISVSPIPAPEAPLSTCNACSHAAHCRHVVHVFNLIHQHSVLQAIHFDYQPLQATRLFRPQLQAAPPGMLVLSTAGGVVCFQLMAERVQRAAHMSGEQQYRSINRPLQALRCVMLWRRLCRRGLCSMLAACCRIDRFCFQAVWSK